MPARVFQRLNPGWLKTGAALALGAAVAFIALAEKILKSETQQLDDAALRGLAVQRSPELTSIVLTASALGSWPFVSAATFCLCIAGFFWGKRRAAATLLSAVLGIPMLIVALKPLYARARPDAVAHLDVVDSASFPSGHALAAAVFYGTLALLAVQHTTSHVRRALIIGCAGSIIVSVALSRVYLGVHYPSDVIGGVLVGTTWSLLVLLAAHYLKSGQKARAGM